MRPRVAGPVPPHRLRPGSTKTKRSKACAHRRRQTPTMWRSQPTCSAMASLLSPSKAKTIMRALHALRAGAGGDHGLQGRELSFGDDDLGSLPWHGATPSTCKIGATGGLSQLLPLHGIATLPGCASLMVATASPRGISVMAAQITGERDRLPPRSRGQSQLGSDQPTEIRLNKRRKARKPVMPMPSRAIDAGSATAVSFSSNPRC